jgi:hypothetical protein
LPRLFASSGGAELTIRLLTHLGGGHPTSRLGALGKESHVKSRFFAIFLAVLAFTAGVAVEAHPPVLGLFPPPSAPVRKDGPFHLGIVAEVHAERRLAQGCYAEPVYENGRWWVVYYTWSPAPGSPLGCWWRHGVDACAAVPSETCTTPAQPPDCPNPMVK